jgi:hypothetical protein
MPSRHLFTKSLPFAASASVVLISVFYKFSLTSNSLLPGLDGAYYWVQVRSLLENSSLAFSDLPLVFYVQAGIAWLLNDIPSAVRISDAILPALSAFPIYLIARRYPIPLLPAVSIAFVLLNPVQLFFFTGDFIKNEAAIPAVFLLWWILLSWDERGARSRYVMAGTTILAISFTHFGTLLLALMILSFWFTVRIRQQQVKIRPLTIGLVIVSSLLVALMLALVVPSRFTTLTTFILNPVEIFKLPAWQAILYGYANPVIASTIILCQLGSIMLGVFAWKLRSSFSISEASVVWSSLIVTFVLSSPIIGIAWFNRLAALAFVPLVVSGIIIFAKSSTVLQRTLIGALAMITLLASVTLSLRGPTPPVLSESRYSDFKEFAKTVELPENSIVVASHGMEFLISWLLVTDVASDAHYETSCLSSYSAIFLLIDKNVGGASDKAASSGVSDNKGNKPADSNKKPACQNQIPPEGAKVFIGNEFVLVQVR